MSYSVNFLTYVQANKSLVFLFICFFPAASMLWQGVFATFTAQDESNCMCIGIV